MQLRTVVRGGALDRLLGRSDFAPLLAATRIILSAAGGYPIQVPARGELAVQPDLALSPAAPAWLRLGLELAWLRQTPGLPDGCALILAGRAALLFVASLPQPERRGMEDDPLLSVARGLAAPVPARAAVDAAAAALGFVLGEPLAMLSDRDLAVLGRLWDEVRPVECLLLAGGDERLALDPQTGLNRYLCAPRPDPAVISFASCTASHISEAGFAAAEQARQALVASAAVIGTDAALEAASRRIRNDILAHFGVADLAEALLTASGTDATLLLTGLLAAETPRSPLTSLLMSPAETGSGVPEAVRGRHFATCTASGAVVEKGASVPGFDAALGLVTIDLRDAEGRPLDAASIAAAAHAAIEAASARGRVVLHAIDGSKTGLTAPDRDTCLRLAAEHGERLDIVIDACQARLEPARVRWYLEQGWPVLITGSKFFAAPGFCGAILFPRARLDRITGSFSVPDGLAAYAGPAGDGVSRSCAGLLLRWSAALAEMRRFATLPPAAIRAALDRHGLALRAELARHPALRLIAAPRPPGEGWSDRRSVFTFAVRNGAAWLSAEALRPIYRALATDLSDTRTGPEGAAAILARPCLVGQPVQLGAPSLGGLRIAFSAAQISQGGDVAEALDTVFRKLRLILDRAPAA